MFVSHWGEMCGAAQTPSFCWSRLCFYDCVPIWIAWLLVEYFDKKQKKHASQTTSGETWSIYIPHIPKSYPTSCSFLQPRVCLTWRNYPTSFSSVNLMFCRDLTTQPFSHDDSSSTGDVPRFQRWRCGHPHGPEAAECGQQCVLHAPR